MTRPYDSEIRTLRYPRDKARIGKLSLEYFQAWYLAQDSREMIYMAQFQEFKSFIFWHYTIYVRALRMWLKVKQLMTQFFKGSNVKV